MTPKAITAAKQLLLIIDDGKITHNMKGAVSSGYFNDLEYFANKFKKEIELDIKENE